MWHMLHELNLRDSHLAAAAITRIGLATWPCLQVLDMSPAGLTYAAIQQLCQSSSSSLWPALTCLDLSDNNLTTSAIAELIKTNWPCLKHLYRRSTAIDLDAMSYKRRANLWELDIRGLTVGPAVLQVLMHPQWMQSRQIQLTANLGDATMFKQLAAACTCQKLRRLPQMTADTILEFTLRFPI